MPAKRVNSGPTLQSLLQGIAKAPATAVTDITTDSRRLSRDAVFLACKGVSSHGIDFVRDAYAAGVAAIVYDSSTTSKRDFVTDLPVIAVERLQQHIGEIADRFFGAPSAALEVTGVTGTNGKTTVAILLADAMKYLNRRCGYIGTLGQGVDDIAYDGGLTTPSCIDLHRTLASFCDQRATHAAIEVSSHALHQQRALGVRFDSAMFTNLSRDHIDYHGSIRAYFEAKARLFTEFRPRHSIINIDSEFGRALAERISGNVIGVSTMNGSSEYGQHLVVTKVKPGASGSEIRFAGSFGTGKFVLALPGQFNVENAALVLAHLLCHDVTVDEACDAMSRVRAPDGRMQRIAIDGAQQMPAVYVDFAHTPAGLESALKAARAHCTADLWCVFGCGGDRDKGKRPQMGAIAEGLADRVVVTSDNPRNERPAAIIEDIISGMSAGITAIEDRAAAIAYAIENAGVHDTILIAGKGHEKFQIAGGKTTPFSDRLVATYSLERRQRGGDAT